MLPFINSLIMMTKGQATATHSAICALAGIGFLVMPEINQIIATNI
jgi:hypothetical protein